jgi:HlyD family secretion protein
MKTNKPGLSWPAWILGIMGAASVLMLLGTAIADRRLTNSFSLAQAQSDGGAAPDPQRVEVAALGRLEPQGEVVRVGGPTGERIGELLVQRGDFVEPDQILAYLESYAERLAERDYAAIQLAEAEERLRAATLYGRSRIAEAQTRIEQIQAPGTFEIEAQAATVRQLEAELELAQEDLQRLQSLFQEGAISQQALDQQKTEVRQQEEQLKNAQATLIRVQSAWNMDLKNAQAQLQAEEANLSLTQIQVAVESARQNLKLAEARLDRTIIRAPSPGHILRILTKTGESIGTDGILDLGNTQQMVVVAEVYETDVSLVKIGQPAQITSRNGAFSQTLTGQVSEIGWQIFKNNVLDDDPAANADARVVEVKISLNQSELVSRLTNLQVDVRIDVKG